MNSRFQIRLIKARKRHVGVHRHKERVDVLAAVVLVFKAGDGLARRRDRRFEIDYHHVLIQLEQLGWQLDVTILYFGRRWLAVDGQIADRSLTKIQPLRQHAAVVGILHKPQLFMPADRIRLGRDRVAELVADILHLLRAQPCQIARNAFRSVTSGRHGFWLLRWGILALRLAGAKSQEDQ